MFIDRSIYRKHRANGFVYENPLLLAKGLKSALIEIIKV
jgi:hypothetical protein